MMLLQNAVDRVCSVVRLWPRLHISKCVLFGACNADNNLSCSYSTGIDGKVLAFFLNPIEILVCW